MTWVSKTVQMERMTSVRPYRIVVAIDFSEITEVVLESALDVASRHESAEIHVVSVLSLPRGLRRNHQIDQSGELEELEKVMRSVIGEKLADFGHPYDDLKGWRVMIHTRVGAAAQEIVDLAWEAEADVIVVGRHGVGGRRLFLLGTVPERVLRLSRCPVLVVQPTDYGFPEAKAAEYAQCPACVDVRRESQGGQWFCKEHSDLKLSRSTLMAHHSTSLPIGGGPML